MDRFYIALILTGILVSVVIFFGENQEVYAQNSRLVIGDLESDGIEKIIEKTPNVEIEDLALTGEPDEKTEALDKPIATTTQKKLPEGLVFDSKEDQLGANFSMGLDIAPSTGDASLTPSDTDSVAPIVSDLDTVGPMLKTIPDRTLVIQSIPKAPPIVPPLPKVVKINKKPVPVASPSSKSVPVGDNESTPSLLQPNKTKKILISEPLEIFPLVSATKQVDESSQSTPKATIASNARRASADTILVIEGTFGDTKSQIPKLSMSKQLLNRDVRQEVQAILNGSPLTQETELQLNKTILAKANASNVSIDALRALVATNPKGASERIEKVIEQYGGNSEGFALRMNQFIHDFFDGSGTLMLGPNGKPLVIGDNGFPAFINSEGKLISIAAAPEVVDGLESVEVVALSNQEVSGNFAFKDGVTANRTGTVTGILSEDLFSASVTLSQKQPTGAGSITGILPSYRTNEGIGPVINVSLGDRIYNGIGFSSVGSKMVYYHMNDNASGEQLTAVLGTKLANATLPKISYNQYNFLPDLNIVHSISQTEFGAFDYNIINAQLLPIMVDTNRIPNLPGMLFDWAHNQFLFGGIEWNYTSASDYRFSLFSALGDIDADSTAQPFSGSLYRLKGGTVGMAVSPTKSQGGFIRSDGVYGDTTNGTNVQGMIIEGVFPNTSIVSGEDPFATTVAGEKINQPMMQVPVTEERSNKFIRSTKLSNGYMAGYMKTDIHHSPAFVRYHNTAPSNLLLSQDAASDTMGMTVTVDDVDSVASSVKGMFGVDASPSEGNTAFIGDGLYGMEQGRMIYDPAGAATDADAVSGMVLSGIHAGAAMQCAACSHVDWGVWAAKIDKVQATDTEDWAHMVPYVEGQITQNLGSLSLTGTATYNGIVHGQVHEVVADVLTQRSGTFSANIDMDNRQLTEFSASFMGRQFGFTGQAHPIPTIGDAAFSGLTITESDGGNVLTGTINGALFGPNAEDIGGNFNLSTTDGAGAVTGTGVYMGSRQ